MMTDSELEQSLRKLSGEVASEPSIVNTVMDQIRRGTVAPPSSRRALPLRVLRSRLVRWFIPLAAAAAVVLAVIEFRPGEHGGNGIVWADVVKQIQTARTAHMRWVQRDPTLYGGKEIVADMYFRVPNAVRLENKAPSTERDRVVVWDGQRGAILFPKEKRYGAAPRNIMPKPVVADYLALLSGFPVLSDGGQSQDSLIRLGAGKMRMADCGLQHKDGRSLRKYGLEFAERPEAAPTEGDVRTYCWLEPASKQVTLMTQDRTISGAPVEVVRVEVRLNIDLPDELFSTALPPGYTEDLDSVAARGLEDLYTKYEQARDRIRRYRLIAWEDRTGTGVRPVIRCARDGEQCRVEQVQPLNVQEDLGFEAVWAQLTPARNGSSVFLSDNRTANVLWNDGKVHRVGPGVDSSWMTYVLAGCGWPKWPSAPLDTVLDEEECCRRLPDRSDKLGLIGIRYERLAHEPQYCGRLEVLWIDPARSYLCVSHAVYWRYGSPWKDNLDWQPSEPVTTKYPYPKDTPRDFKEHDDVREIVEFGQTAEGQWYPVAVRHGSSSVAEGKRYLRPTTVTRMQVDFAGPIPASLFEWPAEPLKRK